MSYTGCFKKQRKQILMNVIILPGFGFNVFLHHSLQTFAHLKIPRVILVIPDLKKNLSDSFESALSHAVFLCSKSPVPEEKKLFRMLFSKYVSNFVFQVTIYKPTLHML